MKHFGRLAVVGTLLLGACSSDGSDVASSGLAEAGALAQTTVAEAPPSTIAVPIKDSVTTTSTTAAELPPPDSLPIAEASEEERALLGVSLSSRWTPNDINDARWIPAGQNIRLLYWESDCLPADGFDRRLAEHDTLSYVTAEDELTNQILVIDVLETGSVGAALVDEWEALPSACPEMNVLDGREIATLSEFVVAGPAVALEMAVTNGEAGLSASVFGDGLVVFLRTAGDVPLTEADRLDFDEMVRSLVSQLDAGVIRHEFDDARTLLG